MNTLFRDQRIQRILYDLKGLIYHSPLPLKDLVFTDGFFKSPADAAPYRKTGTLWKHGQKWGGRNSYCWLHESITLPESHRNKSLALCVSTEDYQQSDTSLLATFVSGPTHRWDLMNPQFMLFINGHLRHGLDTNHTEVILNEEEIKSPVITFDFQGYAGLTDKQYGFYASLSILDEPVNILYYHILTLFECAQAMSEDSPSKRQLTSILNEAINFLDLRIPGNDSFYKGLDDAIRHIETNAFGNPMEGVSITCVGHTHIDVAWLWDLKQTRLKAQRSFSTVLSNMDRYPDYVFMQSTPQIYDFVKEDSPELYSRIQEAVQSGKWEPEGAMWLEADCNIPSGESLVRQILYGKEFFNREFGKDSRILWMPDVFGYSAALPQILKKSGVDCFVTSKISWNMLNTMPYDTFMWKGIDGEEILTYFITTPEVGKDSGNCGATYNGVLHPEAVYGTWKRYKQKEINQDVMMCYGYGDGGGGPTTDMLEKARRLEKGVNGFPKIVMGNTGTFFSNLLQKVKDAKYLPKWVGELYLELHQGTYTSMGEIKKNNRKAEIALKAAEFFQVLELANHIPTDTGRMKKHWKTLLLNQFHDILPGSSIEQVYIDSRQQFARLFKDIGEADRQALKNLTDKIHTQKDAFVVFNTLSFQRDDYISLPKSDLGTAEGVADTEGNLVPAQTDADGNLLIHIKNIPSLGYRTLYPASDTWIPDGSVYPVSENHLENEFYILDFDEAGFISRLYDKTCRHEVLEEKAKGNCLKAYDDRPYKWDTWNIDMYYEEKFWEACGLISSEVIERGPLRYGIRQHRKFQNSHIYQDIYIYHEMPRIDFVTEIDWKEDSLVLKAEFPVEINSDYATYDIQFGNVRRPTHANTSWDAAKYEVCAHKWADLSEGNYGVSLLNDSKYGYSIHDNTISLTLLKCGLAPYDKIDRCRHRFTYSLYPHTGTCYTGRTIPLAHQLNSALTVYRTKAHAGTLPESLSFLHCDNPNVIIDTVKPAEREKAFVIRLYETCNEHSDVTLYINLPCTSVKACNLLEIPEAEYPYTKNQPFHFQIKPFEIKTFLLYY